MTIGCVLNVSIYVPGKCLCRLAVFSMFLLVFQGSVCDDWLCSQCFYLCSREVFVTTGCVLNVSTCVPGKCL